MWCYKIPVARTSASETDEEVLNRVAVRATFQYFEWAGCENLPLLAGYAYHTALDVDDAKAALLVANPVLLPGGVLLSWLDERGIIRDHLRDDVPHLSKVIKERTKAILERFGVGSKLPS